MHSPRKPFWEKEIFAFDEPLNASELSGLV
jgi:hypothetical protein